MQKHTGRYVAFIYFGIYLCAPNTIYYAQELRSYAMLLGLSSVFCVLYFLIRESLYARFTSLSIWYFVGLSFVGVLLILTHYYAYIFCFCAGLALLLECLYKKSLFLPVFLSFLIIGCVGVAWILVHIYYGGFYERIIGSANGQNWIHEGSVWSLVWSVLLSMFGKYGIGALILTTLYLTVSNFAQLRSLIKRHIMLCLPIVFEICMLVVIFTFVSKTMTTRYFIEIYPFGYLFVALILGFYGRRVLPFVCLILVCLSIHSFLLSATYKKEDIRAASAYIATHFDSAHCKLPVSWISYARYLPEFEFVTHPLKQESCDLILLSTANETDKATDFKATRDYLSKHNISEPYCFLYFDGALLVLQKCAPKSLKD